MSELPNSGENDKSDKQTTENLTVHPAIRRAYKKLYGGMASEAGQSVQSLIHRLQRVLPKLHPDHQAPLSSAQAAELLAELERKQEAFESIRVFAHDCIENGHDRGSLGNLYSIRDLCDKETAK